jgi:hypothetical protein
MRTFETLVAGAPNVGYWTECEFEDELRERTKLVLLTLTLTLAATDKTDRPDQ